MTETNQSASAQAEDMCKKIKDSFYSAANAFLPPDSAGQHFRQARIEMLKGVRAIIDHRIDRLSKQGAQGTRVVVE